MRRAVAAAHRTYLRRPAEADQQEFVDGVRRSRSLHEPYAYPAGDAGSYRSWLVRGGRPDTEQFLVCRRDDDAICGYANLNHLIGGNLQQAFIGYGAFVPHAGAGQLTEGVGLVLRLAFSVLQLHRIEANIQPGNDRSRALAVRCGFRLEGYSPRYLKVGGRWCDHERWAITAEDWRADERAPRPATTRGSSGR